MIFCQIYDDIAFVVTIKQENVYGSDFLAPPV